MKQYTIPRSIFNDCFIKINLINNKIYQCKKDTIYDNCENNCASNATKYISLNKILSSINRCISDNI